MRRYKKYLACMLIISQILMLTPMKLHAGVLEAGAAFESAESIGGTEGSTEGAEATEGGETTEGGTETTEGTESIEDTTSSGVSQSEPDSQGESEITEESEDTEGIGSSGVSQSEPEAPEGTEEPEAPEESEPLEEPESTEEAEPTEEPESPEDTEKPEFTEESDPTEESEDSNEVSDPEGETSGETSETQAEEPDESQPSNTVPGVSDSKPEVPESKPSEGESGERPPELSNPVETNPGGVSDMPSTATSSNASKPEDEEELEVDIEVYYTLKVVDTYISTEQDEGESVVRYVDTVLEGEEYCFSALEVEGYIAVDEVEYSGVLIEDLTLEFIYIKDSLFDVSLLGGTVLSNDYASAELYEDEKLLIVTDMYKSGRSSDYPWYNLISGYRVEFADGLPVIYGSTFSRSGIVGDLVIPASVTEIGNNAFSSCTGLTGELVISEGVTSIGNEAFRDCSNLTGNLVIPDSVTSLGNGVFRGCSHFSSLTLSGSLQLIPDNAFRDCSGFRGNLVIPESVKEVKSYAFFGDSGFDGTLTIGDSVQAIRDGAFYNCSGLTGDLVIPDNVTSIGNVAFQGCKGMRGTLSLGSSLITIGDNAFKDCSGFTDALVIPDSVVSLGEGAFYNARGFSGFLTLSKSLVTINREAFRGCTGLTGALVIPDTVETIGNAAFLYTGFSGTLTLGNSVRTIGNEAFKDCKGLKGDLIIHDAIESIGSNAFNGCTGFNGVLSLGSHLKTIGGSAFKGCTGLKGDLVIPDNVISLGTEAFNGCTGFDGSIKIGSSIQTIEAYAFNGCSGLSGDMALPDTVKLISYSAFNGCSNMGDTLVIPDKVTTISRWTFNGSDGVTIIRGGEGITSLLSDGLHYGAFRTTELTPTLLYTDNEILLNHDWGNENREIYFEVAFNSNGGTPVASQHVKAGELAKEPKAPTRDNYVFIGWTKDKAALTNPKAGEVFDFATPITRYTVLYAKWAKQVTITVVDEYYDSEGITQIKSVEREKMVVGEGEAFEVKALSPRGYEVVGEDVFSGTADEDTVITFQYWEKAVKEHTITVTDEYYDTDGTTLLDSVQRVSEVVQDGESYQYEALTELPDGFELVGSSVCSGVCTEDTAIVFKYVKVQKFTVTVLDTYYDVDNTTLLSSEVRVSELIRAGSSYSYEALGTIGFKVTGQDSYTGIVSEDITLTFRYIEDIDVLGGTLVISIPAEMELKYDSSLNEYIKTDSIYASGRCGVTKQLNVETPRYITFVNGEDNGVKIDNGLVEFGTPVADDSESTREQWSGAELREGLTSPVRKNISVSVDKREIDYLGSYKSVITYHITMTESSEAGE